MRPPLFIVCSPLSQVGKTLLARLLAEFFINEDVVEAFDLSLTRPSLIDYLPEVTSVADLADTRGQMALFDHLIGNDDATAVVDLGQGLFERFFTIAAQVSLADELRERQRRTVALFIANPDPTSARAYVVLQRWLAGMVLVPVYNEALSEPQSPDQFPFRDGASLPVRLPFLGPGLRRVIADPSFSFAAFRGGEIDLPKPYREALDTWVRQAFIELRELELRLLLSELGLSGTGRHGERGDPHSADYV